MASRLQVPKVDGNYLYCPYGECNQFSRKVYIPDGLPDWVECTPEQKAQWEEEFRIKELERIRKEHEEMGIPLPEDFEQSMM
jgi:hypothetical protein